MSIVVKWGRERLNIPLPPPSTKLAHLRTQLAEHTHLPEHAFKLIHAGAVMKDDNAPISAYNIRQNSTIALVGGADSLPHKPAPSSEQSTISQIHAELDKVRSALLPSVDVFLATLPSPSPSYAPLTPEQEHTRLAELLLQSLLRLDAINADGGWADARKERKGAVREVQGLLDRLDGAWKASLTS